MPDPIYGNVVNLLQLAIMLLIPLEILLAATLRIKADYEMRDTLATMMVSVGSIYLWGVLGWLFFGGVLFAYAHRLFNIPFTWWTFAIAFVLEDCRYYWWHRISHRSRWFWASHVVHHSSQHYNLSVNLRQSWTSQFSGLTLLGVPLAWLGFHPSTIALAFSLNLLYQFWIHTEAIDRMPRWFEALLNTPSHHRVHHASNPRYLDANYAGVFMIWDRLFGTFVAEDRQEPARYGLVKNLTTFNPVRIATHEYVAIAKDLVRPGLTLLQRLAYLFAPPGWSHDGTRHSTESLRAAEAERRQRSQLTATPVSASLGASSGVQNLAV
jgi:sterol desaturase/sphingolipid hydroxylase (fatty acid hydroxylase superfamily)